MSRHFDFLWSGIGEKNGLQSRKEAHLTGLSPLDGRRLHGVYTHLTGGPVSTIVRRDRIRGTESPLPGDFETAFRPYLENPWMDRNAAAFASEEKASSPAPAFLKRRGHYTDWLAIPPFHKKTPASRRGRCFFIFRS